MKKLLLSIVFIAATVAMLVAQTPQMSYQAVIRDVNGRLIVSQSVTATVKIRVGESELFSQTYTETTNMHGLLTVTFGDAGFATIDWANASISCEVKNGTDVYIAENFQPVTTVPLAIKAISEGDPQFNASVASDITAADTLYWNHKLDAEVDGSVTNELQALSISHDTVYLSNGGFVKLPTADGSETKVAAGTNLTITGSGTTASPYVINASCCCSTHYPGELYGGGVVFWVDQTGQHGLICSMIDLSTTQVWSNVSETLIGETAQSDWDGNSNTTAITAQSGHTSSAAKLCADYTNADYGTGTYNDWYLPSLGELNDLWYNLKTVQKALDTDGNGSTTTIPKNSYWSSSESTYNTAWTYYFYRGYLINASKQDTSSVRAVRAF